MEQVAVDHDHFYVLSCRKPDPALSGRAREHLPLEVLTVPKRAGTYMLLRAPFDLNVQERDLVAEPDADTDAGERVDRPRAPVQQDAWRNWQRETEDRIAGVLAGLGPVVLYVHGYHTKPGDALRAGVILQQALDRRGVGATVLVFAWPSAGHLFDCFPDQKDRKSPIWSPTSTVTSCAAATRDRRTTRRRIWKSRTGTVRRR